MKRTWMLIAATTLLGGCATYRQVDGYYVENAPTGGTVAYANAGAPWVAPYYNPFFGSYLPAYGYAPYVYGGAYVGGPVVVYRHRDRDERGPRASRRAAAFHHDADRIRRVPTESGVRTWERRAQRYRASDGRAKVWQGASSHPAWRGPRPSAGRSEPVRRPAHAPRRDTRQRHDKQR